MKETVCAYMKMYGVEYTLRSIGEGLHEFSELHYNGSPEGLKLLEHVVLEMYTTANKVTK